MNSHETETGAEFITPTHLRHIMRYVTASKYLESDDDILDAACDVGYGSNILVQHCRSVVGLDMSPDALEYANANYAHDRILFRKQNLTESWECGPPKDKIVSVETIEHMPLSDVGIYAYLENMRKHLKHNGLFIVTTPYCKETGPSPITKQHLCEFQLGEFVELLQSRGFGQVTIVANPHPGQAGRLGYATAIARKR